MLQQQFNRAVAGGIAIKTMADKKNAQDNKATNQPTPTNKMNDFITAQTKAMEALQNRIAEIESASHKNRQIRRQTVRSLRRQRNG